MGSGRGEQDQPFACAEAEGRLQSLGAGLGLTLSQRSDRGVHGSGGLTPPTACPSPQEPLMKEPRAEAIAHHGAGAGERSSRRVKRRPRAHFCSSFAVAGERFPLLCRRKR